ncbi:unnamed protein product [Urochloa decumbens]|uniref:Uncharacterized protein n=1 Tax=Urochloa decumbens TaxID=240449 RepID=A0ABC9C2J8_9POAL
MKDGKKAAGVVVVATMVVVQLMVAPTAMARLPREMVPDGSLAVTPESVMLSQSLCYTGETCKYIRCISPGCYFCGADYNCYVGFITAS